MFPEFLIFFHTHLPIGKSSLPGMLKNYPALSVCNGSEIILE